MNSKSLKLCVYEDNQKIPITISGLTEVETIRTKISTGTSLGISPENGIENLVPNPGFEYPEASGSTISEWTVEYPYWSRSYSGSNIFGERYASTALEIDGGEKTITSGSFSVTPGDQYRTALNLRATKGFIKYVDPNSGISHSEELFPVYTVQLLWYNGASLVETETIVSGSGPTYLGGDLTEETTNYHGFIYMAEDWELFRKTTKAPTGVNNAKISIEAYYQTPTTFSSKAYKDVLKAPRVDIDDVYFYEPQDFLTTSGSVLITTGTNFKIGQTEAETIDYELIATALADDLYGEFDTGLVYASATELMAGYGNFNNRYLRTWIPFEIDFTSASGGVHITEATLEVVSTSDMPYLPDNPTRLQLGFETRISGSAPATASELWEVPLGEYPLNTTVSKSWVEGETYEFDVTTSARGLFGIRGVIWNNTDKCGFIVANWGSALGSYRTFASYENGVYEPAKLTIKYQDNYYTQSMWDLGIYETGDKVRKTVLDVGSDTSGSHRALQFFKLTSIPATATINSANLYLYETSSTYASASSTLQCYPMLKKWDYHTANWDRQYGTQNWTSVGANANGVDVDFTSGSVGSRAFNAWSPLEVFGWRTIPLDTAFVEERVTSGSSNYGMMLKMDVENNTRHRFIASQSSEESVRPYVAINYTYLGDVYDVIIKNDTYTETAPDPEDPTQEDPPVTEPTTQTVSTSQSLTSGELLSSYNFTTTGHKNRYMLIMYYGGDPNATAGEFTTISLGGLEFTKITQAGTIIGDGGVTKRTDQTVAQIWGLRIPDSWSGSKSFSTTHWGPTPRRPVILLFRNVDCSTSTSPWIGRNSNFNNSSSSTSTSLSVSGNSNGTVLSVLSLRAADTTITPNVGSGQTRLTVTGTSAQPSKQCGGVSAITKAITGTTTLNWTWSTGARNSMAIVSLRPATS